MRILVILFLFLPTIVFSQINQTDANGLRQGKWEKKQANGRPIYEGEFKDGKPVGQWKRYHSGGQVKAEITYNGDTAQTILYDVWRNKVASGNYINQKKEGVWKVYKQNLVVADEEYKLGLKHGTSHRYYETGEVMEEKQWKNNKEDGKHQVNFKSGEPYMQCAMKLGLRHGLFLVYFKNGQQELVGEYNNNLRDGEWKYQDENGKQLYSLHYNMGQLLNPAVRDSIENLKMLDLENSKGKILDPEKFMQDPSEYMIKNRMNP